MVMDDNRTPSYAVMESMAADDNRAPFMVTDDNRTPLWLWMTTGQPPLDGYG